MRAKVPADLDGERADLIVARLGDLSRAQARRIADEGGVVVDGAVVEAKARLAAGSVVQFDLPPPDPGLVAEEVDFGVRYEDEHVAVVDKPPGIVTHPGAGNLRGTLAAGILNRWPRVRGVGAEDRWGIVHRLDRDTSGLLVVALDAEAYQGLREAMRRREIDRTYLALVAGVPAMPTGTIDAPIGRDPGRPTQMRIDSGGRPARTHYRLSAEFDRASLLELRLETGRTHQIRVHLASIGLPVMGDRIYGISTGSPRVFLHASAVAFDHPVSGDRIDAESELPEDLAGVLEALTAT
ncbi:MAG TPA: RluA family pseudouridine synthase [Acidimicrobiia bacterium]|nr:RluA family pseudouridine synthase [Acidimicrobiia bacterium]